MNDASLELYLLYIGLGQWLPALTDLLNKHIPSKKIRWWGSVLISSLIALVFNINRLRFGSVSEFLMTLLILWFSGQAAYKNYYEGSVWQADIRFNASPFPLKELIPPSEMFLPKRLAGQK